MYCALVWDADAFAAFSSLCSSAGHDETGVLLVGLRGVADLGTGMARVLYAIAVIGPGPRAASTPVSFSPDRAYQSRVLTAVLRANRSLVLLGEAHRHPSAAPTPSVQDVQIAAEMALDPGLRFENHVAPIVIATHDDRIGTQARCFLVRATARRPEVTEIPVVLASGSAPSLLSSVTRYPFGGVYV